MGMVLGPGLGAWGTRGRPALGWGQRLVPGSICLEAQEREGDGQGRQGRGSFGGDPCFLSARLGGCRERHLPSTPAGPVP